MPNLSPDAEQPEPKEAPYVSAWPKEERCGTCGHFLFFVVKAQGFWCDWHKQFFAPGEKAPADRWCKRWEGRP